jgi:hypothetical protein
MTGETPLESLTFTKFERWVKQYGALELAKQLTNRGAATKTSLGMVYAWTRGEHEPRAARRRLILQLAAGKLTLLDFDTHFADKARNRQTSSDSIGGDEGSHTPPP